MNYKKLKNGDKFWECAYGHCEQFQVISNLKNEDNTWSWKAKNIETKEIVDYMITEGFEHYGPKIYDYEAYAKFGI